MKEMGAPRGRLITDSEVLSDEGGEDAANLSRGDDGWDVATHYCFSGRCLRIFLSQKLSPSIGREPMHKLLRSKVPYDGRGYRSVLS